MQHFALTRAGEILSTCRVCVCWCFALFLFASSHNVFKAGLLFILPPPQCLRKYFQALTPNLLARTIETVEGGGLVILLLKTVTSLKQLYAMSMDVHSRQEYNRYSAAQSAMLWRWGVVVISLVDRWRLRYVCGTTHAGVPGCDMLCSRFHNVHGSAHDPGQTHAHGAYCLPLPLV